MNKLVRNTLVGGLLASPLAAFAVGPFDTAITTVSTDIATYGAALVGVAAIGVGFMVAMKYVKKISRAS